MLIFNVPATTSAFCITFFSAFFLSLFTLLCAALNCLNSFQNLETTKSAGATSPYPIILLFHFSKNAHPISPPITAPGTAPIPNNHAPAAAPIPAPLTAAPAESRRSPFGSSLVSASSLSPSHLASLTIILRSVDEYVSSFCFLSKFWSALCNFTFCCRIPPVGLPVILNAYLNALPILLFAIPDTILLAPVIHAVPNAASIPTRMRLIRFPVVML